MGPDNQGGFELWWGALALWVWHMWPSKTQDRIAALEQASKSLAIAEERLQAMERTTSMLHLIIMDARKGRDPEEELTELEKVLVDHLGEIAKSRLEG